jgi:predicted small lipoprotein YifL
MARPFTTLILGLPLLVFPACGRKGPLAIPPGREPMAVEGLSAAQRGQTVLLKWANPVKAVSGRPLTDLEVVEIWVFDTGLPAGGRPSTSAEVEKKARLAGRIPKEKFGSFELRAGAPDSGMAFPFVFDPGPAGPKRLAFAVRVIDSKKRASDFSAPAAVDIRACPKPPRSVGVRVFPDFLEVRWLAPDSNIDGTPLEDGSGYVVFRYEGDGLPRKLTPSPLGGLTFEDRDYEFGKAYGYFVRAVAAGADHAVESGDSPVAEIVPRDVFPPAPPAGLAVVAGDGFVSLSWRPARERDLDGYRVWRKEAGGPAFGALGVGLVRENTFIDRSAAKGVSYIYAVSAVDRTGNEGSRSEEASVVAKGARP